MTADELLKFIDTARTPDTVFDAFYDFVRPHGFLTIVLIELPFRDKMATNPFVHYHPDDVWPVVYTSRDYQTVDLALPMLMSLKRTYLRWADVREQTRQNSIGMRMFEEAEQLGRADGVSIPQVLPDLTLGSCTLAGPVGCFDDLSEAKKFEILEVARRSLTRIANLNASKVVVREAPIFSDREREILPLIIAGLTDKEIGRAHGTSHRTIQTQINNMVERLNIPPNIRNKRLVLAVTAYSYGIRFHDKFLAHEINHK